MNYQIRKYRFTLFRISAKLGNGRFYFHTGKKDGKSEVCDRKCAAPVRFHEKLKH